MSRTFTTISIALLFTAACGSKSTSVTSSQPAKPDYSALDQTAARLEQESGTDFRKKIEDWYSTCVSLHAQAVLLFQRQRDLIQKYPHFNAKLADVGQLSDIQLQLFIDELSVETSKGEAFWPVEMNLITDIRRAKIALSSTIKARQAQCAAGLSYEQVSGASDGNYLSRKFTELCNGDLALFRITEDILGQPEFEKNITLCVDHQHGGQLLDLSLELRACGAASNLRGDANQIAERDSLGINEDREIRLQILALTRTLNARKSGQLAPVP